MSEPKQTKRFWLSVGIVLVAISFAVVVPRTWAEGTPDLDEVLNPAPDSAGKNSDADSIADLEKVIEAEDGKAAAKNSAPSNGAGGSSSGGGNVDDSALLVPDETPKATAGEPPPAEPSVTDLGLPDTTPEPPTGDTPPSDSPAPQKAKKSKSKKVANSSGSSRRATSGTPTEITNLEFKMDGDNSRIVISANGPLEYRESRNANNRQAVYYFENVKVSDRLQRAYDTSEFTSSVALFTMLQVPRSSPPAAKLIVQLREDKVPAVVPNERGLFIDFPAVSGEAARATASAKTAPVQDGPAAYGGSLQTGETSFSGRPIKRLEIKNSDIQDVLRLIAQSSGYNIVIGDDVTGKVGTLSLENIPWDQAFALVLQSKKLGYIREGNVLRVNTLATLKQERDEILAAEQAKLKVDPLKTVLIPISYAKANELLTQTKTFLSDRGSVEADARTNTIIVKDVERNVARIQKLIAALDTQPPRVAISAKIVEMQQSFTRQLGFSGLGLTQSLGGVNLDFVSGSPPSSSSGTRTGGDGGQITISAANFANFEAQMKLSEGEGKIKTLANPSVSVVANRQATVNQSFSFFVDVTEVSGGQAIVTKKQVTTNLTLDVTPIVAGDGSIFLTVSLKNEIPKVAGSNTTIDGRNISTQVLLDNGDTAVLGGIFSNTVTNDKTGIPLLMRIPVLGILFSRNSLVDNRNEIFVFLTARITNLEETFKRTL